MSNSITASRKLAVSVVVWQIGIALVSAALLTAAGLDTAPLAMTELELRGVSGPVWAMPLKRATGIDALLAPPGQADEIGGSLRQMHAGR